jgi:hypothetical protein
MKKDGLPTLVAEFISSAKTLEAIAFWVVGRELIHGDGWRKRRWRKKKRNSGGR